MYSQSLAEHFASTEAAAHYNRPGVRSNLISGVARARRSRAVSMRSRSRPYRVSQAPSRRRAEAPREEAEPDEPGIFQRVWHVISNVPAALDYICSGGKKKREGDESEEEPASRTEQEMSDADSLGIQPSRFGVGFDLRRSRTPEAPRASNGTPKGKQQESQPKQERTSGAQQVNTVREFPRVSVGTPLQKRMTTGRPSSGAGVAQSAAPGAETKRQEGEVSIAPRGLSAAPPVDGVCSASGWNLKRKSIVVVDPSNPYQYGGILRNTRPRCRRKSGFEIAKLLKIGAEEAAKKPENKGLSTAQLMRVAPGSGRKISEAGRYALQKVLEEHEKKKQKRVSEASQKTEKPEAAAKQPGLSIPSSGVTNPEEKKAESKEAELVPAEEAKKTEPEADKADKADKAEEKTVSPKKKHEPTPRHVPKRGWETVPIMERIKSPVKKKKAESPVKPQDPSPAKPAQGGFQFGTAVVDWSKYVDDGCFAPNAVSDSESDHENTKPDAKPAEGSTSLFGATDGAKAGEGGSGSLFGNPVSSSGPVGLGSVFGAPQPGPTKKDEAPPAANQGSIFGAAAGMSFENVGSSSGGGSIFGAVKTETKSDTASSLLGVGAATSTPPENAQSTSGGSLFGGQPGKAEEAKAPASTSTSLFGASPAAPMKGSIFGSSGADAGESSQPAANTGSLFGSSEAKKEEAKEQDKPAAVPFMFGSSTPAEQQSSSQGSLFGNTVFGQTNHEAKEGKGGGMGSIFGSTPAAPPQSASSSGGSIFGAVPAHESTSGTTNIFGAAPPAEKKEDKPEAAQPFVFGQSNPSTGNLFSANPTQAQPQTQNQTLNQGSLFGASGGFMGNTSSSTAGGASLFGAGGTSHSGTSTFGSSGFGAQSSSGQSQGNVFGVANAASSSGNSLFSGGSSSAANTFIPQQTDTTGLRPGFSIFGDQPPVWGAGADPRMVPEPFRTNVLALQKNNHSSMGDGGVDQGMGNGNSQGFGHQDTRQNSFGQSSGGFGFGGNNGFGQSAQNQSQGQGPNSNAMFGAGANGFQSSSGGGRRMVRARRRA